MPDSITRKDTHSGCRVQKEFSPLFFFFFVSRVSYRLSPRVHELSCIEMLGVVHSPPEIIEQRACFCLHRMDVSEVALEPVSEQNLTFSYSDCQGMFIIFTAKMLHFITFYKTQSLLQLG